MNFQDLVTYIPMLWNSPNGNIHVPYVQGPPGGGKTAASIEICRSMGGTYNKSEDDTIVLFNPAMRDPVDVLGTPNNTGDYTRWVPPLEFWRISRAVMGDQLCYLVIEELSDSEKGMMNSMCRVVLDKIAGDLVLAPNLRIIANGNRTEDKSGANRLVTKLGNRLLVIDYDENLEGWVDWALDKLGHLELGPILIQFIRFRPHLLADFKADRPYGINPTPRSWEKVAHLPAALPTDKFFEFCKGYVGEGAAAEFSAFRRIYESLVSFEDIVMNPKGTPVPAELSAQYATVGSLAHNVKPSNIERVSEYVDRMSKEFGVMFWQDSIKKTPALKATKPFIKWATSHGNVVLN